MKMAYSRSQNAFLAISLKPLYEAAGSWPKDAQEVDDSIYFEFGLSTPPEGKERIADMSGSPCWVDIPPPDLDAAKQQKRAEITKLAAECVKSYVDFYPAFEVATWPTQESEAIAWQKDPSAATPFCDAIASARQVVRTDLLEKIVGRVDEFRSISAVVAGVRQRLFDKIDEIQDGPNAVDQLGAISWPRLESMLDR